jgi:hypothetical protein
MGDVIDGDEYTDAEWLDELAETILLPLAKRDRFKTQILDWRRRAKQYWNEAEVRKTPVATAREIEAILKLTQPLAELLENPFGETIGATPLDVWNQLMRTPIETGPLRRRPGDNQMVLAPEGTDIQRGDYFFRVWPDHPESHRVYKCLERGKREWRQDGKDRDSVLYKSEEGKTRKLRHEYCWRAEDMEAAPPAKTSPEISYLCQTDGVNLLDDMKSLADLFNKLAPIAIEQARANGGTTHKHRTDLAESRRIMVADILSMSATKPATMLAQKPASYG